MSHPLCHQCQKPLGIDANFCPACGAQQGTWVANPKQASRGSRKNVVLLLAVLAIFVVAAVWIGQAAGPQSAESTAERLPFIPDVTWVPQPGDAAEIYTGSDEGGTYLATDLATYREMLKSAQAEDVEGQNELLKAGTLHRVASRTPLKVIAAEGEGAADIPYLEVRLTSDDGTNVKGYVPRGHVMRNVLPN